MVLNILSTSVAFPYFFVAQWNKYLFFSLQYLLKALTTLLEAVHLDSWVGKEINLIDWKKQRDRRKENLLTPFTGSILFACLFKTDLNNIFKISRNKQTNKKPYSYPRNWVQISGIQKYIFNYFMVGSGLLDFLFTVFCRMDHSKSKRNTTNMYATMFP